jgi:hypothetical protein
MAITGLTTQERRRILSDERLFKGAAVLAMYRQARESDEYQDRRTPLETP